MHLVLLLPVDVIFRVTIRIVQLFKSPKLTPLVKEMKLIGNIRSAKLLPLREKSFTEVELVGVDNTMNFLMWSKLYFKWQMKGYPDEESKLKLL